MPDEIQWKDGQYRWEVQPGQRKLLEVGLNDAFHVGRGPSRATRSALEHLGAN